MFVARPVVVVPAVVLAVCLSAPFASAQAQAPDVIADLSAQSAHAHRAPRGGRLAPGGATRAETIRDYLRATHDAATLRDLVQTGEREAFGTVHVGYGQQVAGLDVYGTYVKASFNASGDLTTLIENLVSTGRGLRPALVGPDAALRAVLARNYPQLTVDLPEVSTIGNTTTYARVPPFYRAPQVTRIAVPLRGAALDTGYLVETWDQANVLRFTVVSGRGEILSEQQRTQYEGYRVFANNPAVSTQQLVTDPADPTASPDGWLPNASHTTTGNNVDAYLDRDANDAADANGRPTSPTQVFDFVWDGNTAPTTTANQAAAVTNLFYLTNLVHDRLYGYGFDEAAGNFQTDNFGRGGVGNDPLNAEAQDGSGTDNANFASPPEGQRPRMQMYLWTSSTPNRDGDVDSDIVYHEYGHGLTWRIIGDMSGAPAGAVGEGMSDALAIYFNNDDRVAEYSSNNPIGIRSAPYTNYTRTYGLVVGILGPHLDGEIYAATMWRLRQLWLSNGWSQDTLLRYIVDGMSYTAPKPAYEDMRDGILSSVANMSTEVDPQAAKCTVWNAFAQYGIGVGADGYEICAIGLCFFKATESFALPADCPAGPPPNTAPVVAISQPTTGTSVAQGTSVTFTGSATDTQDGDLTASLSWSSSIDGVIGSGGTFSTTTLSPGTHIITASVTDTGGLPGSAGIVLTVNAATNNPPNVAIGSPATGSSFPQGTSVSFSGSAVDTEDGIISGNLAWSSSLQGLIGSGASFSNSNLQVGTHTITASVTDSGGKPGSASITVTITAVNITLSAAATKVKGNRAANLTWAGATTTNVDVIRNNVKIVTTANDGSYQDLIGGKGKGSFTYKICNAGSTTLCSNTSIVTF